MKINIFYLKKAAVYQEKKIYSGFLSFAFFGNSIRIESDDSSTSFWLFTNSQVASS